MTTTSRQRGRCSRGRRSVRVELRMVARAERRRRDPHREGDRGLGGLWTQRRAVRPSRRVARRRSGQGGRGAVAVHGGQARLPDRDLPGQHPNCANGRRLGRDAGFGAAGGGPGRGLRDHGQRGLARGDADCGAGRARRSAPARGRPRKPPAHVPGVRVGAPRPRRPHLPAHDGC